MKKWNKKGFTLNDLPSVAIVFLVSTLFLVLAMLVLSNMQTSSLGVTTETITNEAFTFPDNTGSVTLAHTYLKAITSITNATNASQILPAANYSITSIANSVAKFTLASNATPGFAKGAVTNITYTYDTYGETSASVAVNNTLTALQELPNNWFLIIALVMAAVVVIGVVMNNLGTFGNTGGRR